MKTESHLPRRKQLPHWIPGWVSDGEPYFITINVRQRGVNVLCDNGIAQSLLKSIAVYEQRQKWSVHMMVIMPDHLHMIAAFGRTHGIRPVIVSWKRYQARYLNIEWQSGFFEHRLRNADELVEKANYIRMNPVRKGLVATWNEWPHIFCRDGNSISM